MQIISGRVPRASSLARVGPELSRAAQLRLTWITQYQSRGQNAARTCRYFGISRQTFYRWKRRYDPQDLSTLEERSRCPHRRRQPTWTPALAERVLTLRHQYPRWGKDKLVVLLRREGCPVSTSMVGRVLTHLQKRGLLVEPLRSGVAVCRRRRPRPYAVRKPRDWRVCQPGDLVQVDTLDVRPLPGVVLKQFTARDVVSRWDVLEVRTRATATTATEFLATLQERLPFPLQAIQVDGGSEFMAQFEEACQRGGIRLFVLPPHSPKLNGHVERANRTHTEEFWECYEGDLDLASVQPALRAWEEVYNTVRPHQALAYRTPKQFLEEWEYHHRKEEVYGII